MRFQLAVAALLAGGLLQAADVAASSQTTFSRDVLPVLQKNCQGCHRPGQIAPMSFLSYKDARPWAKAMKTAVLSRKMPPWSADSRYGPYLNDRSLKQPEIDAIVRWADGGAPEGDLKDAPPAVSFPEGWLIQPDVIVEGPVTDVPASPKNNVLEWITVIMPTGFTKDTWVTSVQIKPEHAAIAHHICIGYVPHQPNVKYGLGVWADLPRDAEGAAMPEKGPTFVGRGQGRAAENPDAAAIFAESGISGGSAQDCYLPGNVAADYRPLNAAKLIPAGYDIVFNVHYTPNGTAATDHVKVGFTVAKEPPRRRYVSLLISAPTDSKTFAIPPNDPNWQSPHAEATFREDVELVYMMPHMHVRGKDTTWTLEYPDGRKQVVLDVPHYDFNWQMGYDTSIRVPKGTRLRVDAHYDNSLNNKFNPNPSRTVYYGQMTWEEMMSPFFGVVVDPGADVHKLIDSPVAFVSGGA
ncbi:MAG: thiol-disulfide isomerase [Terriglobia bacterium]|nr:MAG: thiol-disulfide isomerase [Terriglobia bacterium]